MEWILAVAFKSVGALLFFGVAYLLARLIAPLIPNGRFKSVLYDRSIKKKHPWKFAVLAMVSVWGTVALIALTIR
jgi:4-hydroxybenzoate polyprenyltransferase